MIRSQEERIKGLVDRLNYLNTHPEIEYQVRNIPLAKCENCNKDDFEKRKEEIEFKLKSHQGMVYGLFAYSIIFTILSAIRNKVIVADLKAFFIQIGLLIKTIVLNLKISVTWVSNLCDKIPQQVVASILHWIVASFLTVGIIGLIGYGAFVGVKKLYKYIKSNTDNVSLLIVLGVLILIITLGDLMKIIFKLNLVWEYIIIIILFDIGRTVYTNIQTKKSY